MRQVLLLRGINLGPTRRVPMADLRRLLTEAGLEDVVTYVQSGNVVTSSDEPPAELAKRCEQLLEREFGFEIPVVVRAGEEIEAVIKRNPLGKAASDPKRYQVTFLETEPGPELLATLEGLLAGDEQVAIAGREVYAWHPGGVARSKLWAALGGRALAVKATSRNWATVEKLRDLAEQG